MLQQFLKSGEIFRIILSAQISFNSGETERREIDPTLHQSVNDR